MKMKVVLLAVMLTTISIRPSLAQDDEVENAGCWLKISSCLGDNDVALCCPIIQQEIDDERDCFCLMKETALQNATIDASFSTILTFCDISGSFQTLCPDGPPTSSTPTTEVTIPASDESLPTDVGECWHRISDCTDSKSDSLDCCPIVKQAIADERECFCSNSDADIFFQYLALCEIRDSFDTICPSSASHGTTAKIPKSAKPLNIKGSTNNNVALSVGLLPTSLLIILALSSLVLK
ncbi:uncharacterized protein LOC110692895 [Chenopodium quinoa]|uniref:uncharacterized protein LOC110692895 n=1 Tax=Chenopodium quinoa TaxID=63459 RepID=UPI000B78F77C|nr:uncharacterized protein LOC110692895 [Chenopodium quinoa]